MRKAAIVLPVISSVVAACVFALAGLSDADRETPNSDQGKSRSSAAPAKASSRSDERGGLFIPDMSKAWTGDTLRDEPSGNYFQSTANPRRTSFAGGPRGSEPAATGRANYANSPDASRNGGTDASSPAAGVLPAGRMSWIIGLSVAAAVIILLVCVLAFRRRRAHRIRLAQPGIIGLAQGYGQPAKTSPQPTLPLGLVQQQLEQNRAAGEPRTPGRGRKAA